MPPPLDFLHGGSLSDADGADTMAAEIRKALVEARAQAGITQPLPTGQNATDMNILFLAIARGVLNHLQKHPHAIRVKVQSGYFSIPGYSTEVDVSET
jgi:hypothetical protein